MKGVAAPEPLAPTVAMVPFPQIEELPPLPPAPGEQPVSPKRMRAAFIAQAIGAVGGLLLVASLFVGGWHHVSRVEVTLGDRPMDDSYVGDALKGYTNNYSMAVWAFLKRGDAIPVIVAAVVAAAMNLLIVGRRRRVVVALGLPCALAVIALILLDLRQVPTTVAEMATHFPAFPSGVRVHGLRPGLMMMLALGGLTVQIGGTLTAFFCLPRARRVRRASGAERQPEREEQPIDEFEPGGAREYAVQGAAPLPQQAADEQRREGQGAERQQYPG